MTKDERLAEARAWIERALPTLEMLRRYEQSEGMYEASAATDALMTDGSAWLAHDDEEQESP